MYPTAKKMEFIAKLVAIHATVTFTRACVPREYVNSVMDRLRVQKGMSTVKHVIRSMKQVIWNAPFKDVAQGLWLVPIYLQNPWQRSNVVLPTIVESISSIKIGENVVLDVLPRDFDASCVSRPNHVLVGIGNVDGVKTFFMKTIWTRKESVTFVTIHPIP